VFNRRNTQSILRIGHLVQTKDLSPKRVFNTASKDRGRKPYCNTVTTDDEAKLFILKTILKNTYVGLWGRYKIAPTDHTDYMGNNVNFISLSLFFPRPLSPQLLGSKLEQSLDI
jgi:hypothetical protein